MAVITSLMKWNNWILFAWVAFFLLGLGSCQTKGEPLTPTAQPGFLEFQLAGEPFRLQGSGALIRDSSFRDRKFFSCGGTTLDLGNALIVSALQYESDLSDECMPLLAYTCGDTLRFNAFMEWQGLDTTYVAENCQVVLTECGDRLMSGVFTGELDDGRSVAGSFRDIEYELR